MPAALVLALVAALTCSLLLGTAWWRERRRNQALHAEQTALRDLVEARVERPNVFSHEVRTPLALISGAAELLAEETPGPLNERQREFVATITSNARQVIGLAEDLLVEAHLQAGLFTPRLAEVDLRELVRDAVREVRRIHTTPIELVNQGPPLLLMADQHLVRQALWNLVNNAIRHAGTEASISVHVSNTDGEAVVQVSDDGRGMSPEDRDQLFHAHVVGASPQPGSGLGMTITQQIISHHGGRLLVETAPGCGTTVFVTLPLSSGGQP